MKKPIIVSIVIAIFIIFIALILPKQKTVDGVRLSDLNKAFTKSIGLDYNFTGKINRVEIFFSFEEINDVLKGSFFTNQNKAIAAITYFYGIKTSNNNFVVILKSKNKISYSIWELNINDNEYIISRNDLKRTLFKKLKTKSKYNIKLSRINKEVFSSSGRYQIPYFKPNLKYKNVNYGSARGYYDSKIIANTKDYYKIAMECLVGEDVWYKKTLDLKMDIYEPKSDTLAKRPLIVFFHGGAFIIGDKGTETVKEFCNFFSSRGYVVAAPNYRMGYGLTKSMMKKNIERCAYRALQDARASIRYLTKNAETYNIDTSQIYIAGYSAGGVIALNVAFMDDNERPASSYKLGLGLFHENLGNLDESTNNIKSPFTIKGIINMWGALGDSSLIQEDENIPLLSFHGDDDHIVPYNTGQPFEDIKIAILEKLGLRLNDLIFEPMFGSKYISDYYKSENYDYTLVTFKGFDHDPHSNPDQTFNSNLDTIKNVSEAFLYDNLLPDYLISGSETVLQQDKISEYSVPYYKGSKYIWSISEGVVIKDSLNTNKVKVIWYGRKSRNKLSVSIITLNNAVRTKRLIVDVN